MDDAQSSYSHVDEIRGLNISLGNVETKSNRHKIRVDLADLMNNLQREVKRYRVDNERLLRAQEEQNQIIS
jgi:hypothetical protein